MNGKDRRVWGVRMHVSGEIEREIAVLRYD